MNFKLRSHTPRYPRNDPNSIITVTSNKNANTATTLSSTSSSLPRLQIININNTDIIANMAIVNLGFIIV